MLKLTDILVEYGIKTNPLSAISVPLTIRPLSALLRANVVGVVSLVITLVTVRIPLGVGLRRGLCLLHPLRLLGGGVPLGEDPSIVWTKSVSVPVPEPGQPSCDGGSSSSLAASSGQSGRWGACVSCGCCFQWCF